MPLIRLGENVTREEDYFHEYDWHAATPNILHQERGYVEQRRRICLYARLLREMRQQYNTPSASSR